MRAWITSLRLFTWGLAIRSWTLLIGVGLGAIDAAEFRTGRAVNVPDWVIWTALAGALFVSAVWTFHDLRMEKVTAEGVLAGLMDRREAVRKVAAQQEKGLELRQKMLAADTFAAAKTLYDPWFIQTVSILGDVAPEYVGEFKRGIPQASDIVGAGITDAQLNDLILRLDLRITRLGEIVAD